MSELEDVQTTVAVIDGLRARIAELEAENERLQIAYDVQKAATCQFVIVSAEDGPKAVDEGMAKAYQVASEQKSRANDAEAELAALKARSCETCEFAEGCDIEAAGRDDAAFTYCSVWEEWHLRYGARAEEGSAP